MSSHYKASPPPSQCSRHSHKRSQACLVCSRKMHFFKKNLSRLIVLLRLQLSWPWQMAMRFLLTYTGTAQKDCNMYCSPPPQPPPPLKQLHWITLVTASSRHHLNCQHHRCPFTTILASTIFTDCHQKLIITKDWEQDEKQHPWQGLRGTLAVSSSNWD